VPPVTATEALPLFKLLQLTSVNEGVTVIGGGEVIVNILDVVQKLLS
jgi:hypothetical protein